MLWRALVLSLMEEAGPSWSIKTQVMIRLWRDNLRWAKILWWLICRKSPILEQLLKWQDLTLWTTRMPAWILVSCKNKIQRKVLVEKTRMSQRWPRLFMINCKEKRLDNRLAEKWVCNRHRIHPLKTSDAINKCLKLAIDQSLLYLPHMVKEVQIKT